MHYIYQSALHANLLEFYVCHPVLLIAIMKEFITVKHV
jgi:hypothetical protein